MTGKPKCTPLPAPVIATAAAVFTLLAAVLLAAVLLAAVLLAPSASGAPVSPADAGCAAEAAEPPLILDPSVATPTAVTGSAICLSSDFLCGGCPRFTTCAATAAYWTEGGGPLDPPILCCGESFACVTSCKNKSCSLACAIE